MAVWDCDWRFIHFSTAPTIKTITINIFINGYINIIEWHYHRNKTGRIQKIFLKHPFLGRK
jgi:hypothetical protein